VPEDRRDALARRAAAEGLSVRALEALAREPVAKTRPAPPPPDAETAALIDRLRFRFATQIGMVRRERGGTIEIRYADDDELLRIVDVLLGDSA
jgi:ParB family chromosome partitioning protein